MDSYIGNVYMQQEQHEVFHSRRTACYVCDISTEIVLYNSTVMKTLWT